MGEGKGHPSDRTFALAIALVTMVAAFNAIDTLLVRAMSAEMSAFSIGFFRAVFGLLFVTPWILRRRAHIANSNFVWMHLLRAALKVLALAAFFYAISRANLSQATAIAFATPIFVIVGAALLLGERLSAARILSVLLGFGGVLIIVRPISGEADPYLLFALAGALLTAAIQLLLKVMAGKDSTDTLVAWNLVVMVPLSLLPALFFWTTPSLLVLGLLAIQGAIGAISMTAITRAVSLADVSAIIPFDFLRLPLVAAGAFYFFDQSADLLTWIGAAIICLGSILATRRDKRMVMPVPPGNVMELADIEAIERGGKHQEGESPPPSRRPPVD